MNRREVLPDGRLVVWRPWVVTWYDADGMPLESRPLTDAERDALEAWQDLQPDAAYVRAARQASAAAETAERAALASVRTLPELVAALIARRSRP